MEQWITLLGGGALGAIVAASLTRVSAKESNESKNNVELWDRTYKLIESLEKQVANLKIQLEKEEGENEEKNKKIRELQETIRQLRIELEKKGR